MNAVKRELWIKRAQKAEQVIYTLFAIGLWIFVICFAMGCAPAGYVRASEVLPVLTIVCDRHDAYVDADPTKKKDEKELEKTSTALLKATFQKAAEQKPADSPIKPADTKRVEDAPKDPPLEERWHLEGEK